MEMAAINARLSAGSAAAGTFAPSGIKDDAVARNSPELTFGPCGASLFAPDEPGLQVTAP
jgi:hypothetical protein